MSDSHISRLLGLKEKLEDLGSNLGDSVIFSEPFKFFFVCVSSGARWNTGGYVAIYAWRTPDTALSLVAGLGENMEPGTLPIAGTQCMLTLACCFPWQWLTSVPLLCLG